MLLTMNQGTYIAFDKAINLFDVDDEIKPDFKFRRWMCFIIVVQRSNMIDETKNIKFSPNTCESE